MALELRIRSVVAKKKEKIMNLYIRYFDSEIVATELSAAIDFLSSIPEIDVDEFLINDLTQYYKGNMPYPKRYKVRGRNYFIVIKTLAATLEEFKLNANNQKGKDDAAQRKEAEEEDLRRFRPGWYAAGMMFRRVVQMPLDGKCQYFDTDFRVRLKATSIQDCYERLCDHLRNRFDVDTRSQLPSIKGKNFSCQYLGME